VSELMSVLDGLAADDLFEFSGRGVLDRTTMLIVARNRIDAELARTVRRGEVMDAAELDDGIKTMASWLRGHCRLSPGEASRVVRRGRVLESLPAVAAGFAEGVITAEQVSVAAAVARPEHVTAAAAQDVDLTQIDAALAEVAMTRPHADLGRVVHHYLDRLDPDGIEPDPTEGRSLSIHTWSDGTVTGRFQLDALGGEKVQAALEAIVQADRPKGDLRSRAQQLADGLVQLADIALGFEKLPMHRGSKPHVVVTLGAGDLFDRAVGQGMARLGFGSWFSAQQTRQVACDGDLTPITIDEHGVPLDEGRTKRVVPPHIRRAVVVRDENCVFAGCTAPSYWCDVHHLVHWIDGGETSVENSGLLCERHHTKVHHGFTIERDPTGRWRTYRPDGTEILLQPLLL
jgi:hypothetical protein